ncbi:hypothetical protein D9M69_574160 [compost metagenome]
MHRFVIKALLYPPNALIINRQRRTAIVNAIKIVAGTRRETRIKSIRCLFDIENADAFIGHHQMRIKRITHFRSTPILCQIDMNDLRARMNACIGAACRAQCQIFTAEFLERLFDGVLNCMTVFLPLPADIGRAVIFDSDFITRHCSENLRHCRTTQKFLRRQRLSA